MASGSGPARLLAAAGLALALLYALVALGGEWTPRSGVETGGGTRVVLPVADDASARDLAAARDVLAARLGDAGVAGARVRTSTDSLLVEVPERTDLDVLEAVVRPARLSVRVVADAGPPAAVAAAPAPSASAAPSGSPSASPSSPASSPGRLDGGPLVDDPVAWAARPDVASTEAFAAATCAPDAAGASGAGDPARPLVACDPAGIAYLLSAAVIDGEDVDGAEALPSTTGGGRALQLDLDADGTEAFAAMTRALAGTGRQFAVVVDDRIVATPTTSVVADGRPQISTDLDEAAAAALAAAVRGGALPVDLDGDPEVAPLGAWLPSDALGAGLALGALLTLLVLSAAALLRHGVAGLLLPATLLVGGAVGHAGLLLLARGLDLVLGLPVWVALALGVALLAGSAALLLERARSGRLAGSAAGAAVQGATREAVRLGLAADAVVAVAGLLLLLLGRGPAVDGAGTVLLLVAAVDAVVRSLVAAPLLVRLASRLRVGPRRPAPAPSGAAPGARGRSRLVVPVALAVVAVVTLGLLLRPIELGSDLAGGAEVRSSGGPVAPAEEVRSGVEGSAALDAPVVAAAGDDVLTRVPEATGAGQAVVDAVRDASGAAEVTTASIGPAWGGDDTRWLLLAVIALLLLALGALAAWTGRWRVVPAALAAVAAAVLVAAGLAAWSGGPVGAATVAAVGLVVVLALAACTVVLGAATTGTSAASRDRLTRRESAGAAVSGSAGWLAAAASAVALPAAAVLVAALASPATGEVTTAALVAAGGAIAATALVPALAVPLLVLLEERDAGVREADRRVLARRRHDDRPARPARKPTVPAGTTRAARGPVQTSGAARRQQPTRRTRAQRGRGTGQK